MPEHAALNDTAYEAAKRFLELIAIVDDGALGDLPPPKTAKSPPKDGLGVAFSGSTDSFQLTETLDAVSPIDYEGISKASIREGVFCALVRPDPLTEDGARAIARGLAKADIIVLDWRITGLQDGLFATWVIKELQARNPGRKHQVVCIYSDYPAPAEALESLAKDLGQSSAQVINGQILTGSLVIVWRSKTGVEGFPATESAQLPEQLIREFATRHTGLVPVLAMDALAAVRLNTLPILERYSNEADHGFVLDCLLLGGTDIVAPSIRAALADDLAVSAENVAEPGRLADDPIRAWVTSSVKRFDQLPDPVRRNSQVASTAHLVEMITGRSPDSEYRALQNGASKRQAVGNSFFEEGDVAANFPQLGEMYARFSSLLATQFWPSGVAARLGLGTIVADGSGSYAVCIQPSCDGVRLDSDTRFPLLAVNEISANPKNLIATPVVDGKPRSLFLTPKIPSITVVVFTPDPGQRIVITSDGSFSTNEGTKWRYVSRLRMSHAHRVLQALTDDAGRIGVAEGEFGRLLGQG